MFGNIFRSLISLFPFPRRSKQSSIFRLFRSIGYLKSTFWLNPILNQKHPLTIKLKRNSKEITTPTKADSSKEILFSRPLLTFDVTRPIINARLMSAVLILIAFILFVKNMKIYLCETD
jgi:hypothetical protein